MIFRKKTAAKWLAALLVLAVPLPGYCTEECRYREERRECGSDSDCLDRVYQAQRNCESAVRRDVDNLRAMQQRDQQRSQQMFKLQEGVARGVQ